MQEDIKYYISTHTQYPQLVKLGVLTAFALLGRWLFFTGSQLAIVLGCLIYVGVAVYLALCVVRYFAKRR
jgi:uncharacterized membrane protein